MGSPNSASSMLMIALSGTIAGTTDDMIRISISSAVEPAANDLQRVIVTTSYLDPATGQNQSGERFDATPVEGFPLTYEFSALRLSRQAEWSLDVTVRF